MRDKNGVCGQVEWSMVQRENVLEPLLIRQREGMTLMGR